MVLLGLAIILGADATPNGPLANLRDWTFDAYQRYWPGSRSTDRILVIEIDGDSLRHVGQWPWPRDKLARLVDLAATARVVGIDLLLTEPDRLTDGGNETDAILAASLRRVPVVLAAAADPAGESSGRPVPGTTPVFESGDDPRPDLPHYRSVFWPQAALAESAAGIGLVTVPAGADGILRRMPTVTSVGPLLIPSFAIEVVRVATRANRIGLRAEPAGGRTIKIGEGSIATDNSGGVWPRYSAAMVIPSVPAGRVLTGEIDPAVFRNRVVLIGASAPGLGDAFETPLRLPQSGVLIQAQLVESLLAGSLLLRPSFAPASERLLAVVLALAATFVFGRIRDRTYALLCGGAVILLAAGSFGAFAAAGLLLDATLPVTALLGTNLILLAERTHREVQAQREREVELTNALREAELRREAETARQSLTIALDAARMGMWDSDLIAGTSRCSARHDEIFGYAGPPSEWSRETLLGRVIAADRDLVSRSLDTAMATGTLHFQCRICRSDGSIRSIVVDGRVYHAGDGTPIRVAGVVADVTEQRHIEEALQRTQRLQAVGSLAGGVAHHFNNLLAVVLGNLDLAARPRPEIERIRPYLEAATAAAERGGQADLAAPVLRRPAAAPVGAGRSIGSASRSCRVDP